MDNCLTTTFNTNCELVGEKTRYGNRSSTKCQAFWCQSAKDFPNSSGVEAPFFFRLASSVAPRKWGITIRGVCPEARRLTKLVREKSNLLARSGEGQRATSRRWLGRRPDGPGADPEGKDFTPFKMVDSVSFIDGGTSPGGRLRAGDCRCWFSISKNIWSSAEVRPSEVKAFIVLLYWPFWGAYLLFWCCAYAG